MGDVTVVDLADGRRMVYVGNTLRHVIATRLW